MGTIKSAITLITIFISCTLYLYVLSSNAPDIDYEGKKDFSFPSNLEDLKSIAKLMRAYYEKHDKYVFLLFSSAYIYKQSFMIPGSVFLNILGGALFGVQVALPLCCLLTGIGATCSYFLSRSFGKGIVEYFWWTKVRKLREKIVEHEEDLFYYLLFLRLFPMTPNWLVNLMAPLVCVPLKTFFVTITLGLIPYNYVCIQAGDMIATLTSMDEIFSPKTFLQLASIAVVSVGPTIYYRRLKKYR